MSGQLVKELLNTLWPVLFTSIDIVNSAVDMRIESAEPAISSWSAAVPDVIRTEFTVKLWKNGKIIPLLSSKTPWHIWLWSYSPALSCCLVFLMYAENLEKISIPAVFDSRCLAASLGYLEREKQCEEQHLVTSNIVMITNTVYMNKKAWYEEKSLVWGTAINIVIYLRTKAWQVSLH